MKLIKRKPKKSQAIKNKHRGKAVQKRVVESLGGMNIGTLGGEDGKHSIWSIEVKSRLKFVGEKFMKQCEMNCKDNKTPLLVVHLINQRQDNDLVIMRYKDWNDWFGQLNQKKGD